MRIRYFLCWTKPCLFCVCYQYWRKWRKWWRKSKMIKNKLNTIHYYYKVHKESADSVRESILCLPAACLLRRRRPRSSSLIVSMAVCSMRLIIGSEIDSKAACSVSKVWGRFFCFLLYCCLVIELFRVKVSGSSLHTVLSSHRNQSPGLFRTGDWWKPCMSLPNQKGCTRMNATWTRKQLIQKVNHLYNLVSIPPYQ